MCFFRLRGVRWVQEEYGYKRLIYETHTYKHTPEYTYIGTCVIVELLYSDIWLFGLTVDSADAWLPALLYLFSLSHSDSESLGGLCSLRRGYESKTSHELICMYEYESLCVCVEYTLSINQILFLFFILFYFYCIHVYVCVCPSACVCLFGLSKEWEGNFLLHLRWNEWLNNV